MTEQSVILQSILTEQREDRKKFGEFQADLIELKSSVKTMIDESTETNIEIRALVRAISKAEMMRVEQDARIGQIERGQLRHSDRLDKLESRQHVSELETKSFSVKQKGLYTAVGTIITAIISFVFLVISKFWSA